MQQYITCKPLPKYHRQCYKQLSSRTRYTTKYYQRNFNKCLKEYYLLLKSVRMNPLPVILLQRHKCSGSFWLICLNKYDTGNMLLCIYYLIQIHALSLLPCILYYYTKTWMCSAVIFFQHFSLKDSIPQTLCKVL